jgi:hypothetical protein
VCGIAAFSISDADFVAGTFDVTKLTHALLEEIEYRGGDATGMAWFTSKDRIAIVKQPITAKLFTKKYNMWNGARTAVLHTRAWTKGSTKNPLNNHPIKYENIVGVHNGWLYNDDDLFDTYDADRYGEVDSEAIFMTLVKAKGEVEDKLQLISGPAAVAWLDQNRPGVLHVSRVSNNPVTMVTTRLGSVIMASGHSDPQLALKSLDLLDEIDKEFEFTDGEYIEVENGSITVQKSFDPPLGRSYMSVPFTSGTGWTSSSSSSLSGGTGSNMLDLRRHNAGTVSRSGSHSNTAMYDPEGNFQYVIDHYNGKKYYSWGAYYCAVSERERPNELTGYEAALSGHRFPKEALDVTFVPRVMPIDLFFEEYPARCKAIQDYAVTSAEVFEYLGDVRPGMWVATMLADQMVTAQVMCVPDTFPDGTWYLRAHLTHDDKDHNEFVIIKRTTDDIFPHPEAN